MRLIAFMEDVTNDTRPFKCSFKNCNETFATERTHRWHTRAHRGSAPLSCTHEGCDLSFGTESERNKHVCNIHNNGIPKNHRTDGGIAEEINIQLNDDCRFNDSIILNSNRRPTKTKPSKNINQTTGEKANIEEIADNAVYLVSQIRDATKKKDLLANWDESDFRNIHQWGVWVQENMNELDKNNYEELKHALEKRNVNMEGLFEAEEAVLYTLLSDTMISEERLGWIFESLSESTLEKPFDGFVKVASERLNRNNDIKVFERFEKFLTKFVQTDYDRIFSVSQLEAQAKGQLLASRIKGGLPWPKHSKSKIDDIGWGCVLLWTAYYLIDVTGVQQNFWSTIRDYASHDAIWSVPPDIMCQLCHHDVGIMDHYLSKLLNQLKHESDYASEATDRIKILLKFTGYVTAPHFLPIFTMHPLVTTKGRLKHKNGSS